MTGHERLSEIQKFYAGKNILITGATGFLGNILLEKLLRSCREIGLIYLLIRPKRGKSCEERIDELFDGLVFDLLKKEVPDFRKKIVGVVGDISLERLGLSTVDRDRIANEVSIIFHVAATVRFHETLKTAVTLNVDGTKNVIDLSRECRNLQAVIHVSTAYSNCCRLEIGEELYPSPLSYEEVHTILKIAEKKQVTKEQMETETQMLIEGWPNTYSFSKAIAENVVAEYAKDLPCGVFRPSIVIGCWEEPIPGWATTLIGLNGVIAGIGLGIIHTALADMDAVCDMVPVDLTCNCLIASAWDVATNPDRRGAHIPVYNYVSGKENPLSWNGLMSNCHFHGYRAASNYAVWYNSLIATRSVLLFTILDFVFHAMPTLIVDCVRRLLGKEPVLYKFYCKTQRMRKSILFFASREWKFETDNVQNLWNRLESADKQIFPFSIRIVVWRDYMLKILNGIRRYVMKEPESTKERARRKRFALFVVHNLVRAVFFGTIIWIAWKIFAGCILSALSM